MPDANAIPVIDLGPYLAGEPRALDRAAAELRYALTEIGFYTIINHGVSATLARTQGPSGTLSVSGDDLLAGEPARWQRQEQ